MHIITDTDTAVLIILFGPRNHFLILFIESKILTFVHSRISHSTLDTFFINRGSH